VNWIDEWSFMKKQPHISGMRAIFKNSRYQHHLINIPFYFHIILSHKDLHLFLKCPSVQKRRVKVNIITKIKKYDITFKRKLFSFYLPTTSMVVLHGSWIQKEDYFYFKHNDEGAWGNLNSKHSWFPSFLK